MNTFFSQTWTFFTNRFQLYGLVALISQAVVAALTLLVYTIDTTPMTTVIEALFESPESLTTTLMHHPWYIALFVVTFCIDSIAATVVVQAILTPNHSDREIIRTVLPSLPLIILIQGIVFVLVCVGGVLFILPGLMAIVYFYFASPFAVLRGARSLHGAFSESITLVSRRPWYVAAYLLLTYAVVIMLQMLWAQVTSSVISIPGASIIVGAVGALCNLFAISLATHLGLHLVETPSSR